MAMKFKTHETPEGNTQDVVIFNLEDKIRDDLLNLNVNEKP